MTSGELGRFIGKSRLRRKLAFWSIHMTTLREWYLKKSLLSVLENRSQFGFLDAGCGLGQHAVWVARNYPGSRVTAVDANKSQIDDCQDYANKLGLTNLNFDTALLGSHRFEQKFDVILCTSVLEHIKADDDVLASFAQALTDNGSLIVYVPTSEKRVLRSLERKIEKMTRQANAELPHEHVRYYQPQQLMEKLKKAGFNITKGKITYGTFGRWSYDLFTSVQYNRFFILIFPFYLLFLHPVVLLLMWLDTRMNNKEGNGFLVIAEK